MGVEILALKMRAVLRRWGGFNFLTYIYFLGLQGRSCHSVHAEAGGYTGVGSLLLCGPWR